MNPTVKFLISTAGAAIMAIAIAGCASAASRHPANRTFHPVVQCADPGSHIWCAPAPSHYNDAAEAAGGGA